MRHKWLVTALHECAACGLHLRVPKDRRAPHRLYERGCAQGFTTTPPTTRWTALARRPGVAALLGGALLR